MYSYKRRILWIGRPVCDGVEGSGWRDMKHGVCNLQKENHTGLYKGKIGNYKSISYINLANVLSIGTGQLREK